MSACEGAEGEGLAETAAPGATAESKASSEGEEEAPSGEVGRRGVGGLGIYFRPNHLHCNRVVDRHQE